MIRGKFFGNGYGHNGSEEDIFLGSESDGVVDGDSVVGGDKATWGEFDTFDLLGEVTGKNGAGEGIRREILPTVPPTEGGLIEGDGEWEEGQSGGIILRGELGKLAKGRAPAGVFGLESLGGADFVVVFGVGGASEKKIEEGRSSENQEECARDPLDKRAPDF